MILQFRLWHLLALVAWLALAVWLLQHLFVGFLGRRIEPEFYSKFQAAQQAFDTASSSVDFLKAAALYQEILDAGVVSGVVLYNQGNAFMRGGYRGRAVACYLQAQRYRPRDPYLDANLLNALGERGPRTKSKPVIEYVLFWLDWISYPGKFELTTCAALATLALAVTSLFWRRPTFKYLAVVALGLTLVVALSAAYDWYRFSHLRHGVVIHDATIARKGNADSFEPAFTKPLTEATEFQLLEHRGAWLLIRLSGSQEGWIPRQAAVVF